MKFNLTITDMNEDEFATLFANINCKPVIQPTLTIVKNSEEVVAPVAPETPVELPADTVDKDGLKWDSRIHSSNHQMTAKGVWQRRRGISDEEFNAVRNELLGLAPSNEPVAPISIPVVEHVEPHVIPMTVPPVVAPAPVAPEPTPAPVTPVAPEPTPAPVTPVAPEPNVSPDIMFQTMFKKLQAGLGNNTLKGNDIKNLLDSTNAQFGLQCQNLTQFKDNVSAIQFIINELTIRGL